MPNPYFQFKQFTVHHDRCAMKVTTDSCFFGAWAGREIKNSKSKTKNLLDIGTGTGLLSLMIAQKNNVEIDAVEIDTEAAEQAKENINASPWNKQIKIFNEDILTFQPAKKYDCIICNPPFYENELRSEAEKKNIAHHSRQLTIAQLLSVIKNHLKENGFFFLLFPFKRKEEIEKLFLQNELHPSKSVILQQSVKHSPFRVIAEGVHKKTNAQTIETISIWNEEQQYTERFTELLKDYYLYL